MINIAKGEKEGAKMGLMRFGKRRSHLIVSFLAKMIRPGKQKQQPSNNLAGIFAGNWQFVDENNSRIHHLHISLDLSISLDGRALPGSVLNLNEKELVFLDTYGYHLRIDAIDEHPISVYDEADDRVYQLTPCDSTNL